MSPARTLVLGLVAACASAAEPRATAPPERAPASTAPSEDAPETIPDAPAAREAAARPEALAEPALPPPEAAALPAGAESLSLGGPNDGRVVGAVALPLEGPGFRFNPRRREAARFGTVEMVGQLMRAAARAAGPEPFVINDLGLEEGGPIAQHGSHRAGRDVDVLFAMRGPKGAPYPPVGAFFDREGRGMDFRELGDASDDVPLVFDAERTWAFLAALIEGEPDAGAPLQRVFVAEHLRARLLAAARELGAPRSVRERFAMLSCQPSTPHDDHLHLRFFCAPKDIPRGCEDALPHYPWRRAALRPLGLAPVRHRPRPDRPRAPTTSADAARAAAGPVDAEVVRWLDRREAWSAQPHPGRRWCR